MEYRLKEIGMQTALQDYQSPIGFRSIYKGVPFGRYEEVLRMIDFTKYYVMFRGPRNRGASSTRKRDAKAFDVYRRDPYYTNKLRIEREAFWRGVEYANR